MPSLNDLAVAAFITLLVFGGIYVPRVGDAIGRFYLRRRGYKDDDTGPDDSASPGAPR
jgi:hypothetical protein